MPDNPKSFVWEPEVGGKLMDFWPEILWFDLAEMVKITEDVFKLDREFLMDSLRGGSLAAHGSPTSSGYEDVACNGAAVKEWCDKHVTFAKHIPFPDKVKMVVSDALKLAVACGVEAETVNAAIRNRRIRTMIGSDGKRGVYLARLWLFLCAQREFRLPLTGELLKA